VYGSAGCSVFVMLMILIQATLPPVYKYKSFSFNAVVISGDLIFFIVKQMDFVLD